jgi:hypothetical protein
MGKRSDRSRALVASVLACLVLFTAIGCKKKRPPPSAATVARAADLKPKATQRLAQLATLKAKTKSEPQTASDTPLAKKLWPVKVAVIGESFLDNPNRSTDVSEFDLSDATVSVCKSILEATQVQDDDIKSLEDCSGLEYAAVIRLGRRVAVTGIRTKPPPLDVAAVTVPRFDRDSLHA